MITKSLPSPTYAGLANRRESLQTCSKRRAGAFDLNRSLVRFLLAVDNSGAELRSRGSTAMKTHKGDILIQRLDENRYAVAVDGVVRYVGSQAECERRLAILAPKSDRASQDRALGLLSRR